MARFVYVDNSNVWIEGMRVSAVRKGLASSAKDAMERHITDQSWTYDFRLALCSGLPGDRADRAIVHIWFAAAGERLTMGFGTPDGFRGLYVRQKLLKQGEGG